MGRPKQASKEDRRRALDALIYSDAEDGAITWGDSMSSQGAAAATNCTSRVDLRGKPTLDDQERRTPKAGGTGQGVPTPDSSGPRNASDTGGSTTKVAVGNSLSISRQGAERDQC